MTGLAISGILQGVITGLILAFITCGMTMIYRISGVANFAHGSLFMLAMYLTLALSRVTSVNSMLLVVVTAPFMWCIGLVLYWALIRPIRTRHHLLVVQLLLGLSFAIDALLLISFGGDLQSLGNPFNSHFLHILGTGFSFTTLIGATLSLVGLIVLAALMRWSDFGRHLRAAAGDTLAARLAGIPVERLEGLTWAAGVAILGVIAPVTGSILTLSPEMGLHYTILSLVILIIGGRGSLVGTIFGGLAVGITQSLGLLFLPGSFGASLPYVLLIVVLVLHPGGLATLMGRT